MSAWADSGIPSQAGKLAVITGANSGVGYFTALELAKAGAHVILACRNAEKGTAAAAKINAVAPGHAMFEALDLSRLAAVHDFAASFKAEHGTLDLLINNAGIMAPPTRQVTDDGFEQQFGVNFLGHFALTALLLPALMKAPAPRVIQLSSVAHRQGRIDLTDLQSARAYKPWKAYNQSKLAMLMFALELQRRSDAGGWGLLSLAAHPGIARTALVANGPGARSLTALGLKLVEPFISQSAAAGALPTLFAATAPQVTPGGYYGPTGFMEFRGPPGRARPEKQALDAGMARALWKAAEALTGLSITPGP
jgi:NAD(P)-dependent dehydrogenase (short-subunit alcohol dehydrogenase family)